MIKKLYYFGFSKIFGEDSPSILSQDRQKTRSIKPNVGHFSISILHQMIIIPIYLLKKYVRRHVILIILSDLCLYKIYDSSDNKLYSF